MRGYNMKLFKKTMAFVLAAAMMASVMTCSPDLAQAAKKVKISKSKVTVKVGVTTKISLKNGNKKAKVTWKSSKPKIAKITKKNSNGKNAYAKIKGMKAGKSTLTATYNLSKKSKK